MYTQHKHLSSKLQVTKNGAANATARASKVGRDAAIGHCAATLAVIMDSSPTMVVAYGRAATRMGSDGDKLENTWWEREMRGG